VKWKTTEVCAKKWHRILPNSKDLTAPLSKCSGCGYLGRILEIFFGMLAPNFDFDKYIAGGCCVADEDQTLDVRNAAGRGFLRIEKGAGVF